MELLDNANADAINPTPNPLTTLSPGSPSRGESFGVRRGLAHAALGLMLNDDTAYTAYLTSKAQGKKASKSDPAGNSLSGGETSGKELEGFDLAFTDSVPWNDEPVYLPIMPGTYTTKRRHDTDKQEVLSQVAELDVFDMLPIVATCEFALCVYYARSIILRVLQFFRSQRKSSTAKSSIPQILFSFNANTIYKMMKSSFKQHVVSKNFSDRLFPLIIHGNLSGDLIDKLPSFSPFISNRTVDLMNALYRLELTCYKNSLSTIATEDYSIVGVLDISKLLKILVSLSLTSMEDSQRKGTLTDNTLPQDSTISSSLSTLQDRILQRVGMNQNDSATDANQDVASKLCAISNSFLSTLIESCLVNLERAASSKYDSHDWITNGLEKSNGLEGSSKAGLASSLDGPDGANHPSVLFSYWALKTILTVAHKTIILILAEKI